MALNNISDVFAGATISGGNVVIPTGTLPGFSTGNNVSEGAQLVYGLLNALNKKVVESSLNNISTGSSLVFNNGVFVKSYNFGVNLGVGDNTVEGLDVVLEPNAIVPNLVLSVDSTTHTYDISDDTVPKVIGTVGLTSDGNAVDASTTSDYSLTFSTNPALTGGATLAAVANGTDWDIQLQSNEPTDGTYVVTVGVEDNRLQVDQQPAETVTLTLTVQA
jgi:hypothetical protein